jgi:hypothetical protein
MNKREDQGRSGLELLRFAQEQETFRARRHEWIAAGHEGEWVVIRGQHVDGPYPGLEQAVVSARARFAPGTYFVKQITAVDRVHVVHQVQLPRDPR